MVGGNVVLWNLISRAWPITDGKVITANPDRLDRTPADIQANATTLPGRLFDLLFVLLLLAIFLVLI